MTDNDVCHLADTLDLSEKKKRVAATIEIDIIQNVTPTKSLACKSPANATDGKAATKSSERAYDKTFLINNSFFLN
tara:strand:+ start:496 stop:723 length:228 start_codon:yes stop_codon:yes gene_type:complete